MERNIATGWYERLIKAPAEDQPDAQAGTTAPEFIKDPYVLEFLGMPECEKEHESKLEAFAGRGL